MVRANQLDFISFAKAGIYVFALVWVLLVQIFNPHFVQLESALLAYSVVLIGFVYQFSLNYFKIQLDSFKLSLIDTALIFFIAKSLPFSSSILLFIFLFHVLLSGLILESRESFVVTLLCCGFLTLFYVNTPETKPFRIFLSLSIHHLSLFSILGLSLYFSDQFLKFEKTITSKDIDLRSQENFLQGVMENAPSGILTYNQAGEVILKNPIIDYLFNLTDKRRVRLADVFKNDDLAKKFLNAEVKNFEIEISSKYLNINKNVYWDEKLQSYISLAIVQDQTRQREVELQLRQQEKLAAIGGLAAGIAHEIRNPLAGISGSVELLSQTQANPEDQKLMKIILKEIDRLNNLVGEFLDYAKPDTPPTEKINLSAILVDCIENVKANKVIRQDIQFDAHIEENIFVLGFDYKMKQVFLNILINAAQAMQNTSFPLLKVSLKKNLNKAHIAIVDNGSGMNEETKKRLFEPFHTTKPKGTGLGLAITHKILTSHHARVQVKSEPNQGTEFSIEIALS